MAKVALGFLALLLSSSTAAQRAPIVYTEEFKIGNNVDLNQGWYVCDQTQTGSVVENLIDISDDFERRAAAEQLGCPFSLSDEEGPTYQVTDILNSVCEDRQVGYQLTQSGREDTTICGREGHALVVESSGERKTVILLSLDISYD